MDKDDPSLSVAKANIRQLFTRLDAAHPALTYEFIVELLRVYNKNANLNEMILRAEKHATSDGKLCKIFFFLSKHEHLAIQLYCRYKVT